MKLFRLWSRKRVQTKKLDNEVLEKALHGGMTMQAYQVLAARTMRKGMPEGKVFLHSLFGAVSQMGELLDLYKDEIQHDTPVDDEHAKKELGDIEWYLAEFCTLNGWDLGQICAMNIEKLRARFPEGFTVQADLNRADNDI